MSRFRKGEVKPFFGFACNQNSVQIPITLSIQISYPSKTKGSINQFSINMSASKQNAILAHNFEYTFG